MHHLSIYLTLRKQLLFVVCGGEWKAPKKKAIKLVFVWFGLAYHIISSHLIIRPFSSISFTPFNSTLPILFTLFTKLSFSSIFLNFQFFFVFFLTNTYTKHIIIKHCAQ